MILTALKFILAHLLPWLVGYLAVCLLDREDRFSTGYRASVAYLLGIGALTMQMFIAGVFGLRFDLGLLLGIVAADLVLLETLAFFQRKKIIIHALPAWSRIRKHFSAMSARHRVLLILCVCIIVLKVLAGFWQVVQTRVFEFDAWHDWNFRAKVIFTEHHLPLQKGSDFYLGGGESSYPLHDALGKVWTATVLGGWREPAVDAYALIYYLVLVGLFYFSLPLSVPFSIRMLSTYLLSSLPYLYFHTWVPYADLEFATYLFLSLSALFWFFTSSYRPYLHLAALGLAGLIWTKNEGFAVVLPVMAAASLLWLVMKRVSWRELGGYWGSALLAAAPWLAFRFFNRLDILSGGSSSFHVGFNKQFLADWFSTVFLRSHFNFLWLLFFFLVLAKAKMILRPPPLLYAIGGILALFFFYNGIIMFTDKAYDLSALTRVNLHLAPFAAFLTTILLWLDSGKIKSSGQKLDKPTQND